MFFSLCLSSVFDVHIDKTTCISDLKEIIIHTSPELSHHETRRRTHDAEEQLWTSRTEKEDEKEKDNDNDNLREVRHPYNEGLALQAREEKEEKANYDKKKRK